MTREEGINLLFDFVENEIKESGWLIFNKRDLKLVINRILEPHEKTANFPLPDSIDLENIRLDKNGVWDGNITIQWSEVCVSGIKTEIKQYGSEDYYEYDRYLLVCLNNGKINEYAIPDFERFKGLLGHYIEQYADHARKRN